MKLQLEIESDIDFNDSINDAIERVVSAQIRAAEYAGKHPGYQFDALREKFKGLQTEFNEFKFAIQDEVVALRARIRTLEGGDVT